ncbi:2OG-Fe(II) oxygenase [Pararoseomonas indoligenes]|uniref:2OG-Fe(II) oxygenase n=1 Tax=Roseomonas indoligenes TaxID=2820811 RepID=A0A940N0A5_9PROT|nr:2OG-Fe(II) oxygenase [Pararoseomonas indoligenes]MBP0494325.1 2OG-Fe(II) oxygenase [Pararoseomonas indoligenes]
MPEASPMPPDLSPLQRFRPGDPVPRFHAATDRNPRYAFDSVAGRYVVLAFLGSVRAHAQTEAAWGALRSAQAEGLLDDNRACAFVITADPPPPDAGSTLPGAVRDHYPGLRVFRDRDLAVSGLFGACVPAGEGRVNYHGFALLLDPALRVLSAAPLHLMAGLLDGLRRLPPPDRHAGEEMMAPVLTLPRVLDPEFCQELIALYERHGGEESGFMREVGGRTVGMVDASHKRRRDHEIVEEPVRAALRGGIQRRLLPEIERAFQFKATRIERYIVACYDAADGGHFRAHRDNTTKGTAHRRFAVTINLNDDFEGGELWFPEFGSRRFRAPIGGAVVFSCSLLHEATRVTRGRRYATLPFLYDEEAARIRAENRAFLAGTAEDGGG